MHRREQTLQAIRKAFAGAKPPTAIFASNDLTTRFSLQALGELGLTVPDEIAIIGFDDFELAAVLQPTLTVVRQPAQEVGRVAAELLFAPDSQGQSNPTMKMPRSFWNQASASFYP